MKKHTVEEALAALRVNGDSVHTFLNPTNGMLIGANWSLQELKDLFDKYPDQIYPTGGAALGMRHGLAVKMVDKIVFIETTDEFNAASGFANRVPS